MISEPKDERSVATIADCLQPTTLPKTTPMPYKDLSFHEKWLLVRDGYVSPYTFTRNPENIKIVVEIYKRAEKTYKEKKQEKLTNKNEQQMRTLLTVLAVIISYLSWGQNPYDTNSRMKDSVSIIRNVGTLSLTKTMTFPKPKRDTVFLCVPRTITLPASSPILSIDTEVMPTRSFISKETEHTDEKLDVIKTVIVVLCFLNVLVGIVVCGVAYVIHEDKKSRV